ncbi:hypothetical protein ES703_105967 [subsurface metagenome]
MLLFSRIIAGMATESAVAQAYITDMTSEKERAAGLGKVGAAHGAGFIIGPALGGFLSIYGFLTLGIVAAVLTGVNFLFAFFFLPESNTKANSSMQTSANSDDGYWRRLASALTKPLIGTVFVILFVITFAFSAIPVIVPLLGIAFFGFAELEMSYFFMYIGVALGMLFMPLFPSIAVFVVSITLISSGIGTLNTVLPSFISKRTPADEQGGMLGVAQSVGSIARIPGPLVGGLIAEFAGLNVAFLLSATLVTIAFVLGFKLFRAHRFRGQSTEAGSCKPQGYGVTFPKIGK